MHTPAPVAKTAPASRVAVVNRVGSVDSLVAAPVEVELSVLFAF
jgi:hypothetical protein